MERRNLRSSCARTLLALVGALAWTAPALAWESRSEPDFFRSRLVHGQLVDEATSPATRLVRSC